MKFYNLIDYKGGKFTIIQDKDRLDDLDIIVGEISYENAVKEMPERHKASIYYGVPCCITKNKKLLAIIKQLDKDYETFSEKMEKKQ